MTPENLLQFKLSAGYPSGPLALFFQEDIYGLFQMSAPHELSHLTVIGVQLSECGEDRR